MIGLNGEWHGQSNMRPAPPVICDRAINPQPIDLLWTRFSLRPVLTLAAHKDLYGSGRHIDYAATRSEGPDGAVRSREQAQADGLGLAIVVPFKSTLALTQKLGIMRRCIWRQTRRSGHCETVTSFDPLLHRQCPTGVARCLQHQTAPVGPKMAQKPSLPSTATATVRCRPAEDVRFTAGFRVYRAHFPILSGGEGGTMTRAGGSYLAQIEGSGACPNSIVVPYRCECARHGSAKCLRNHSIGIS